MEPSFRFDEGEGKEMIWWILGGAALGLVAWTWVRAGALADEKIKNMLPRQGSIEGEEDFL